MNEIELQKKLFSMQDKKYAEFQKKLIPTVAPDTIIGVRTPEMRKFAKEFAKSDYCEEFMLNLPHKYYDENNLHGSVIAGIKNYDKAIDAIERFFPYIDNWATCDMISPKVFKKHLPELLLRIRKWIKSDNTYEIRFGIEMLMSFYLDDNYSDEISELVAAVKSEEYYVNMIIAWYFATALAKQYENVLPYIEKQRLDKWTHNKTIQKAVESYRITDEQKAYLRSLKIK